MPRHKKGGTDCAIAHVREPRVTTRMGVGFGHLHGGVVTCLEDHEVARWVAEVVYGAWHAITLVAFSIGVFQGRATAS